MSDSTSGQEVVFRFPRRPVVRPNTPERVQRDEPTAERQAFRVREEAWLHEKSDLLQRQDLLAREFEHRLINSLQIIVSLLSLQSRTAGPEAAAQLTAAALRVGAFGRVHRQLHLLDHEEHVEFKQYIERLCEDLSGLLFQGQTSHTILVEGANIDIPTKSAIPLGFIVNELITNSAKYAHSNITVRLETTPDGDHLLSVLDDGPGLATGFDPAASKGLGMKIVTSLVKQIGGELQIGSDENGHGARFTVAFRSPRLAAKPHTNSSPSLWGKVELLHP